MRAEVEVLAREEAVRPFDLEHGPLLRAKVLRLGAEEHVLLVTMHHIISDVGRWGVLMREASTLYNAYAASQPSPLQECRSNMPTTANGNGSGYKGGCWKSNWNTGGDN